MHAHSLGFPTVPTIDQLPALLRDYVAAHQVARQVGISRAYSSMAYLAAFIGANLADWQDHAQATTRLARPPPRGWVTVRSPS